MTTRYPPWKAEEATIIDQHWRETDADIVVLLADAGFNRGSCAVASYRYRKGLVKPRFGSSLDRSKDRRSHTLAQRASWPEMPGTQEERDAQYVRLLARALAQQEAA